VATVEDIAGDEQLAARDYFQRVDYPCVGQELTLVGPFAKFSASPVPAATRSPSLGEHNEEVFAGELDVESADLARLYAQRVL
jgi:formyl-CoA transferase